MGAEVDAVMAVATAVDTLDMVEEAVVTAGTVTDRIIPIMTVVGPMPIMAAATAMSMRQALDELDKTISLSSPIIQVVLAQ